jgi:hypothetical protein
MTPGDPWSLQQLGVGCYLCQPRVSEHLGVLLIAKLAVSSLYLAKDQRFRGLSTLILNDHATGLDVLVQDVYAAYMQDLRASASMSKRSEMGSTHLGRLDAAGDEAQSDRPAGGAVRADHCAYPYGARPQSQPRRRLSLDGCPRRWDGRGLG